MKNLIKLPTLFKRDTTGKIRMWEVEYAEGILTGLEVTDQGSAGTRTISGLVDGQKVTSDWNLSTPKNVGKWNKPYVYNAFVGL